MKLSKIQTSTTEKNSSSEPSLSPKGSHSYAPKPWLIIRWLLEQRNAWAKRPTELEAELGQELRQVDAILDLAKVPTEDYAAQAGGTYHFTRAGRVDWLARKAGRLP